MIIIGLCLLLIVMMNLTGKDYRIYALSTLLITFVCIINFYIEGIDKSLGLVVVSITFLHLRKRLDFSLAVISLIIISLTIFSVPLSKLLPIVYLIIFSSELLKVNILKKIIILSGFFSMILSSISFILIFLVLSLLLMENEEIDNFVVSILILSFNQNIFFNFIYATPLVLFLSSLSVMFIQNRKNNQISQFLVVTLLLMLNSDLTNISLISSYFILISLIANVCNHCLNYMSLKWPHLVFKKLDNNKIVTLIGVVALSLLSNKIFPFLFLLFSLGISSLKYIEPGFLTTKKSLISFIPIVLISGLCLTPGTSGYSLLGLAEIFSVDLHYGGFLPWLGILFLIIVLILISKYVLSKEIYGSMSFVINRMNENNHKFIIQQVNKFLDIPSNFNLKSNRNRIAIKNINFDSVEIFIFSMAILIIFIKVLQRI